MFVDFVFYYGAYVWNFEIGMKNSKFMACTRTFEIPRNFQECEQQYREYVPVLAKRSLLKYHRMYEQED
jgi:hypothetical protein